MWVLFGNSPPTGLKANALSDSEISLTWKSVESVSSYNIYMGTTRDNMDKIETSTEPSIQISNLQADTVYYLKVSCSVHDMESKPSDIIDVKTKRQEEKEEERESKHENFSAKPKPIPKGTGAIGAGSGAAAGTASILPYLLKGILIAAGIILIILIILFLIRSCKPQDNFTLPPGNGNGKVIDKPEVPPEPPISSLTYNNIRFVMDTRFFLSEGNHYTNTPPDMSEGRYEDRLGVIAQDMKKILAVSPEQVFIISGYAANIPGYEEGKIILSTQRAEKVKNMLISLGVPSKNLQCLYAGGTDKWGNNSSEETRKLNRVVTIELAE